MEDYIWYASYGSNISTERFLCYITGGQAIGAQTSEMGCRDKSLPLKYENITIPKKQYFAKSAFRWQNQGVAFLDSATADEETFGRMYLITKDQFSDVVKQENKMHVNDAIDLKLEDAMTDGSVTIIPNSWYGRLLFLGRFDGYPIYTFTNIKDFDEEKVNAPSHEYLQMIGRGLNENYHLTLEELSYYFMHKTGVNLKYSFDELKNILSYIYKKG